MKLLTCVFLLSCSVWSNAFAQVDSSALGFTYSGYVETYYAYDFNRPSDGDRPAFVYSHNRHNEVAVNLAMLKAGFSASRFRGNLALMAGTYPNANLSAEPGTLQHIFEANAGVKLCKNRNLWIDAGILPSHIGFESAIGKDCSTLTRSIAAENSPYYEAGAKLSYTTPAQNWSFSILLLNGWQTIRRPAADLPLAGGWQIQFLPSAQITLNSSSYWGASRPDSVERRRFFHNFYGNIKLGEQVTLNIGLDTGWETPENGNTLFWYSPMLIGRYAINDRVALAGRAEYYSDPNGVLISTNSENGFQGFGLSANLDVQVHQNALWRLEGRFINNRDAIFATPTGFSASNTLVSTALAVWF